MTRIKLSDINHWNDTNDKVDVVSKDGLTCSDQTPGIRARYYLFMIYYVVQTDEKTMARLSA